MKTRIERALELALDAAATDGPPQLASAMHYAVFPGGARVRPRLCVAVAEAAGGGSPELVDATAAALELLHCASLVHDDLPCFDDAELRRGKPSVHRAFGEPLAVLTGDALIVLAFETLARAGIVEPIRLPSLIGLVAASVGAPGGIVAGQAWESEGSIPLERYHRAKTGALFVAAAMGGACAVGRDPGPWRTMGERLGEAYQVADDLLDAHATAEVAGKPTQQDARLLRPSAVDQLGTEGAVARLRGLVDEAADAVPECAGAPMLRTMVIQLAERLVPASLRQTAA